MIQNSHFMDMALVQAQKAAALDEVPVGAIITDGNDNVIAQAHNRVLQDNVPFAHAELLAIQAASQQLKTTHLIECTLYVTLEPCPMCAHAISLARIKTLYIGAYDVKSGGVFHGPKIFEHSTAHHKPEIYGGIKEQESALLLQSFFEKKR